MDCFRVCKRFGKCISKTRLDGKTAIITGCNTGMGKCTVLDFYRRGCHVVMACRNVEKADEARKDIIHQLDGEFDLGSLIVRKLNLSSLESIREFADVIMKTEPRIDLLINNAGVMVCPESRTAEGFEMQFGTNHLGHFLLTLLLLPRIIKTAPARIVILSSSAHTQGKIKWNDLNWEKTPYSAVDAYAMSKLANILFCKELVKRLLGKGVTVYSVDPGIVKTDLLRHVDNVYFAGLTRVFFVMMKPWTKTAEQGAQTQIYCAVDVRAATQTGLYYFECEPTTPHRRARDAKAASRLWAESWSMVKLGDFDPFTPK